MEQIDNGCISRAADKLSESGVLILPAGTVYGLSCKFDDRQGIEKIYKLKKRDTAMPFIILFSNKGQLCSLSNEPEGRALSLMEAFWFGRKFQPLTLIMAKNPHLPPYITAGKNSIALRFAPPGFLNRLIEQAGPITSTSATISGTKAYPDSIKNIPESIKQGADLIVECRRKLPGVESTIVDITGPAPRLVREGMLSYRHILAVWDKD